ncbi:hypothetical protein Ddye_009240 [Dipteronia dyeriana]|uniref:Receptor-like protein 12 n=1 Tax=Dipteronia dyeriana TaxID=168575 RepID=A0AAE0CMP8_9ROSI|nr:hypothetical protein Ddye_009240 [Dipteronia dyeriana]
MDCCTWRGVDCDIAGRVIGLHLSNESISGGIDNSTGLFGLQNLQSLNLAFNSFHKAQIPSRLANLANLSHLNLSYAGFGGKIPIAILSMTRVVTLDLSFNYLLSGPLSDFPQNNSIQTLLLCVTNLSGKLPDSIGNLKMAQSLLFMSKSLNYLDLSQNVFTGGISSTDWELLQDLVYVDLGFNSLNGSIPSSLFALPSLQHLRLLNNQFEGQIPEFLKASSSVLETLDLQGNRLEGHFPMTIFELKNLQFLVLSSNKFNGTVQLDMIGRLGNLTEFDLSFNNLAVNVSTSFSSFPPQISKLKLASCKLVSIPNLKNQPNQIGELDLSDNQISGEIPNWIWEVVDGNLNLSQNSLVGFQEPYSVLNLNLLDLHSNRLSEKIPLSPPMARFVDYSNNSFTSSIPDDIGNIAPSMKLFSVLNNKLTGIIPESLCNATFLQALDLSSNNFSGRIPTCLIERGENLGVLKVGRNNLYGIIPDRFPGNCGLQTLSMNSNQLEGLVPKSLTNCTMLEVLDLGNNKINDAFPCWLKNVSSLHVLVLRSNKFYGNIGCLEYDVFWPKLQIIDLASNNFTGRIPRKGLTTWKAMMVDEQKVQPQLEHLQYEILATNPLYCQDTVMVTMKNQEVELVKILTLFTSIDLSSNNFQGPIPEELGLFKSLIVLNLSHNAFTGSIPSSIGNLRQLESMDLPMNNLCRHIPTQLASLNFLSVLNLSYNHLVGRIPISTQLQSFSPTSFEGNEGLCGHPLMKSCTNSNKLPIPAPSNESDPFAPSSSNEFDWQFSIVIGVGFGTGFVAVVAPLIFSDKVNLRSYYFLCLVPSLPRSMKST